MKKFDLAIAIRIGSTQSSLFLVKQTIESIEKNIGQCSYRFILSLDPTIPKEVKDYILKKQKESPERFEVFPEKTLYWAEFINEAIRSAQDCEYFIKAHDDIKLLTSDFFSKVKEILSNIQEPIAWVSFTEVGYLYGHWSPPTRPGFYKDYLEKNAWERRKMFQFHRLPENWWKPPWWKWWLYILQQRVIVKILPQFQIFKYPEVRLNKKYQELLDFPFGPVKCHAPWNTFVLIKTSVLNEIGPCENWQTYNALLVDEDWGLRALKLKYWNVWIPSINYLHLRPAVGGDRSQYQIQKDAKRVHELFFKKWGFHLPPTKEELRQIELKHKDNFIPWSIGRDSYDWEHLKLKEDNPKRLHLGCGEIRLKGFVNIDMAPSPAVDRIMDASKLEYPDNSIELIYASHLLEYFHRGLVPKVLKEWHRVLKPGGKAIIVVPNFDLLVDWYTLRFPIRHLKYIFLKYILGIRNIDPNRELTDNFIGDVLGGFSLPELERGYENYHKTLFNPNSFRLLAKEAGFREIKQVDLKKGDFPISQIDPKKLHWASMAFLLKK
jgi:SAM-dependent methyltransferase